METISAGKDYYIWQKGLKLFQDIVK